jgi:hypothetical protein
MREVMIPNAVKALIDRSETPIERLLIWTRLPEQSLDDSQARATQDMYNAIAVEVHNHGLNGGYHITWSFNAERT